MQGSTVNVGERDSQRFLASLQKTESSTGRYPPGSLLLAQDPNDLNRCPHAAKPNSSLAACVSGQSCLDAHHGTERCWFQ